MAQTFVAVPEEEWRELKRLMGEVKEMLGKEKQTEWLTQDQTAELLHTSVSTVYRLRQKGALEASYIGHMVYISRASIDRMLMANT